MWIQLNSYTKVWIQLGEIYSTHNTVMCENYPHFPPLRCKQQLKPAENTAVCFHDLGPLSERSSLINRHYQIKWDGFSVSAPAHLLKPHHCLLQGLVQPPFPEIVLIKTDVTITSFAAIPKTGCWCVALSEMLRSLFKLLLPQDFH